MNAIRETNTHHPEIEALAKFLGSSPDVLRNLTEEKIGNLPNRLKELGFEANTIQAELADMGVLKKELWLDSVGLDLTNLLNLSPIEYAEKYPDQGAPLVIAVLSSIHLSDDHASLLEVAGGTNLSKGAKIGVGVASAAVGIYAVPRLISHLQIRSTVLKLEREGFLEVGEERSIGDFGSVRVDKDFLGFKHVNFKANSFTDRLKVEWNASIGRYNKNWKFEGDHRNDNGGDGGNSDFDEADLISNQGERLIENESSEVMHQGLSDAVREASRSEVVRRNMIRGEADPEREFSELSNDFRGFNSVPGRPKSLELAANDDLDLLAREDIGNAAKVTFSNEISFERSVDFSHIEESALNSEGRLIGQDLSRVEGSLDNAAQQDLGRLKSNISQEINQEFVQEERIAESAARDEIDEGESVLESDLSDGVESVEAKGENIVENSLSDV